MIRALIGLLLLMSFTWATGSCSIQKRKHRPGWYISTNWNKSSHTKKSDEVAKIISSPEIKSTSKKEVATVRLEDKSEVQFSIPSISQDKSSAGTEPSMVDYTERIEENAEEPKVISDDTSVSHSNSRERIDNSDQVSEEERSNFWAKFSGGFLGTLLALIVLVPLFIILLLLNDGDLDDEIFSTRSDNSSFVKAFKNSFNAVIKYGMLVLWILLFLTIMVGLFYLGYSVAGIFGGILALLLFIGFIVLLAYLLGNLIEFMLPDY